MEYNILNSIIDINNTITSKDEFMIKDQQLNSEIVNDFTIKKEIDGYSLLVENRFFNMKYYYKFKGSILEKDVLDIIKYFSFYNSFYSFTVNKEKIETCFSNNNINTRISFIKSDELIKCNLKEMQLIIQRIFLNNCRNEIYSNINSLQKEQMIEILGNMESFELSEIINNIPYERIRELIPDINSEEYILRRNK